MRVKLQSEFLLPEHVSRGGEFPAENGSISDNDMFCALGGKLGGIVRTRIKTESVGEERA